MYEIAIELIVVSRNFINKNLFNVNSCTKSLSTLHLFLDRIRMVKNTEDSTAPKRFSLSSIIPNQYVLIGSVVLIGLLNMYKGLFRYSLGFMTGIGFGVVFGFVLADSPMGQYLLGKRSRPQQSKSM